LASAKKASRFYLLNGRQVGIYSGFFRYSRFEISFFADVEYQIACSLGKASQKIGR